MMRCFDCDREAVWEWVHKEEGDGRTFHFCSEDMDDRRTHANWSQWVDDYIMRPLFDSVGVDATLTEWRRRHIG